MTNFITEISESRRVAVGLGNKHCTCMHDSMHANRYREIVEHACMHDSMHANRCRDIVAHACMGDSMLANRCREIVAHATVSPKIG